MKCIFAVFLILLVSLSFTNCSSNTTEQSAAPAAAPQSQPKPPALYSGIQAFGCVQGLALKWATDSIPVRLESVLNSESNGQGGRASVWRAAFISPSRRTMKYFTCSGSRLKESPPYGPSAENETPYAPDVPAMAFQPLFLKFDSDKAYDLAQQHGGADLLKKNPNQVVKYFVLWNPKQRALYWYVMYGENKDSAAGTGVVNALTGAYLGASKG